ncbi:hypothetical protein KKC94_02970 [Patescibacteria group bacterium]|nr:hypothetical protein [Patescibacteria group bacterium]
MILQIQQQSALIGRKPAGFTEHYYTEWDDGLGKDRISLFMVMTIGSSQVPGEEIGKEAFQLLQDHFLNDLDGDPYDRFEASLREINLMFNEQEKNLGVKFIPNINVVCGVIQKDMLFLSKRGDSQGYLVRQRHVSSITDGLSDEKNTEDVFQNIASGVLEVNDSVILSTSGLVQYVTPSDLAKIFSEQPLLEAIKELSDLLGSDIEEQMVVQSFEILEKSHEQKLEESEIKKEKSFVSDEMEEEAEIKKFAKPLSILREWSARQDRLRFLEHIRTWGRDKILIGIAVVVVVLGVGIGYAVIGGGKQKQLEAAQNKLDVAEDNLVQAETKGAFDKVTASNLLDDAEDLAVEVLNSGILRGEASQLLDQIDEQRDYLDNIVRVDDELVKIVDFKPLIGSEEIVGVVPYQDRRVVYTPTTAFQVLIDQAEDPDLVDGGEQIIDAAYFEDPQAIAFLTSAGKVIEYDEGNSQFADTSDVDFKNSVEILTYSNRIYLLDPGEGQIWKYTRTRASGYGSAAPYLEEDADVDLTGAVSMAIDGSIWILNDDGSIDQLLKGVREQFEVHDTPLVDTSGSTKIYTDIEVPQVYVIDPVRNAIYIYNKAAKSSDLTYSSQYILDGLDGAIVDMYVDKDEDVLVIVTADALYELKF